jgi:hypothetical protein
MAPDGPNVKIDLHPMHLQVLANLQVLKSAKTLDAAGQKALTVLQDVDEKLRSIGCIAMGIFASFK